MFPPTGRQPGKPAVYNEMTVLDRLRAPARRQTNKNEVMAGVVLGGQSVPDRAVRLRRTSPAQPMFL